MKITFDPAAIDAWNGAGGIRKHINMAALARSLGITQISVNNWKHVPERRVEDVSRILRIPCHELRPDLYQPLPESNSIRKQ